MSRTRHAASSLQRALGLNNSTLAEVLGVSRRTILYILKGRQAIPRHADQTAKELAAAVAEAEQKVQANPGAEPNYAYSLPYTFETKLYELPLAIHKAQVALRQLEHFYPQYLHTLEVVRHLDLSNLKLEPGHAQLVRNLVSTSELRIKQKLSKHKMQKRMDDLRLSIRLMEAELAVLRAWNEEKKDGQA